MQDEIKIFDYYFFGVGIVSLVSAFFLMFNSFDYYYVFMLFFFLNFGVSFVLSKKLIRKLNEIYIWDEKKYIVNHFAMAFVSSLITVIMLAFVQDIFLTIAYFLVINFFVMAAAMILLVKNELKGPF